MTTPEEAKFPLLFGHRQVMYRTYRYLFLQKHLKDRLGQMFHLEYDLLLYDITSTYFEGQCARNEQARFGYSRDKRSDCRQVLIALVVSREGMPLGYERWMAIGPM